jgi:hypothetical protein
MLGEVLNFNPLPGQRCNLQTYFSFGKFAAIAIA